MRRFLKVAALQFVLSMPLYSGCGQPAAGPAAIEPRVTPEMPTEERPVVDAPVGFSPVRIEILPLTELAEGAQGAKLEAYVALLDSFGSQIKAPGVVRFEVYEYVQRSAQAKGQRVKIWDDIDLTGPIENHKHWRDFLRAYAFALDSSVPRNKTYILEATCLCPSGKRLSAEFTLRPRQ